MSQPLTWTQCPYCGESTDLSRVGKPLTVTEKNGKLTTKTSTTIKCGYCGKTFSSDAPTMREAFGYDGENDVPF